MEERSGVVDIVAFLHAGATLAGATCGVHLLWIGTAEAARWTTFLFAAAVLLIAVLGGPAAVGVWRREVWALAASFGMGGFSIVLAIVLLAFAREYVGALLLGLYGVTVVAILAPPLHIAEFGQQAGVGRRRVRRLRRPAAQAPGRAAPAASPASGLRTIRPRE
jgi:hypothetical protein